MRRLITVLLIREDTSTLSMYPQYQGLPNLRPKLCSLFYLLQVITS